MNFVDPEGLSVTVVIVGPSFTNAYQGHSGMYIDGYGFYNMAGGKKAGINLWEAGSPHDFIKYLDDNRFRGFEILKLKTTPEQDREIAEYLHDCDAEVSWYNPYEVCSYASGATCAGTLDFAFEEAGIFPKTSRFSKYTPAPLKQRLLDAGAVEGIKVAPPTPAPPLPPSDPKYVPGSTGYWPEYNPLK